MAPLPPPPNPRPDDATTSSDHEARLARLAQRTSARSTTTGAPPSTARTRRKHPARGARAAALGLSLASTAGLAGLFATLTQPSTAESAAVIVSTGSGVAVTTATTVPAPATAASELTVVDGGVFLNKWGPVQIEATFAGDGSLVDVVALQTPTKDGKSIRINDRAVPQLIGAALTTQAASVDTVSGATYTSDGYRQSLQSAIDAARAVGATSIA